MKIIQITSLGMSLYGLSEDGNLYRKEYSDGAYLWRLVI